MQKWTPRSVAWWGATWLLRLAVLGGAFLAWGAFELHDYWSAATYAGMAALGFGLQRVTRRQALGWITDDNGERQKVTSWSRGHAIFTPTTRSRRIVEEAQLRDERRRKLLWMGVLGGGLAAFAWYAWPHIRSSDILAMLFALACLFGSFAVIGWLANFLNELLYLTGWQDMAGAQVLDLPASRPGLDDVMQQKVHGEGRVATEEEALALLNPANSAPAASDIYLGRYSLQGRLGAPLPYGGERHLLLFGPNGSGKGTRLLVPNLLSLQNRSIVVIDPKGELAAITADYRRTVSDVVILNPFGILDIPSAGFNPLASLDPDAPTFLDDAVGVGEALIKIEEKDPHWSESAQGLVVALLMWEVQLAKRERRAPSLENVRYLITEPNEYETGADGKRHLVKGVRITAARMVAEGGPQIASLIARFLRDTDEIASIQSTADRQTWWLLSKPMRDNLAKNDINFAALKQRPITVYVVLPAERMRTHSVWLRLVIVSALRALYKPGGLRTLFMLDEFAQLGHLAPVEDAFGLVRGYGVQLWPILQDLTQLKSLYKERWETFMANAGVVQGFAPNDLTTADWMSRRAGETTAVAAGYNAGDNQSANNQSNSQGMSYQQTKRRVFLPQELMEIRSGGSLLFPAGSALTIPCFAPPYWEIEGLWGRTRSNPYYASNRGQ